MVVERPDDPAPRVLGMDRDLDLEFMGVEMPARMPVIAVGDQAPVHFDGEPIEPALRVPPLLPMPPFLHGPGIFNDDCVAHLYPCTDIIIRKRSSLHNTASNCAWLFRSSAVRSGIS